MTKAKLISKNGKDFQIMLSTFVCNNKFVITSLIFLHLQLNKIVMLSPYCYNSHFLFQPSNWILLPDSLSKDTEIQK